MSIKPILIVDSELLIALDIERIVQGQMECSAVIARSPAELSRTGEQLRVLGLAIVEVRHRDDTPALELLVQLAQSGVPMLVVTPDHHVVRGLSGFPQVPILLKPFGEDELASAIRRILL